MAKVKIQDAPVVVETAGDLLENVVATEVVTAEVHNPVLVAYDDIEAFKNVDTTGFVAKEVIEVQEAELIAADVFIAEDGTEYEFTVKSFLFNGKKYDVTEAVANDAVVLEELVKLKSFILKQK